MEFLNSSDGEARTQQRRERVVLLCDPSSSSDLALSAFVCSVIYNTADSCLIEENAIYIGQSLLPPPLLLPSFVSSVPPWLSWPLAAAADASPVVLLHPPIQIFIACNHLRRRNINSLLFRFFAALGTRPGEGNIAVDYISITSFFVPLSLSQQSHLLPRSLLLYFLLLFILFLLICLF